MHLTYRHGCCTFYFVRFMSSPSSSKLGSLLRMGRDQTTPHSLVKLRACWPKWLRISQGFRSLQVKTGRKRSPRAIKITMAVEGESLVSCVCCALIYAVLYFTVVKHTDTVAVVTHKFSRCSVHWNASTVVHISSRFNMYVMGVYKCCSGSKQLIYQGHPLDFILWSCIVIAGKYSVQGCGWTNTNADIKFQSCWATNEG